MAKKKIHSGLVYLLHFDKPYKHAKHYIGFSETEDNLQQRLEDHRNGRGARLMEVLKQNNIGFVLAKTYLKVNRTFERRLKNNGGASRICPICIEAKAVEKKGEWLGIQSKEVVDELNNK